MDDDRLFDEDLTAEEAAAIKAASSPATVVHSKDEFERAKAPSALVRAKASWTEAAVVPGAAPNEAAESVLQTLVVTESSPAVTSEQHTAQYA